MTRIDLAKLRRELADRGLTYTPTCPACGQQVPAKDWDRSGICGACALDRAREYEERERADAAEFWAREHEDATYDAWRNR